MQRERDRQEARRGGRRRRRTARARRARRGENGGLGLPGVKACCLAIMFKTVRIGTWVNRQTYTIKYRKRTLYYMST